MRIGIDIMGGDFAPKKTVHGAILAPKELPTDTQIVLFGRKSEILSELKRINTSSEKFEIIDYKFIEWQKTDWKASNNINQVIVFCYVIFHLF